jgi:glucose-1-phosphate thymidylyltransferase
MIQKAVILAAGEGRRLSPLTETMPKVMLPVANRPMLEHVLNAVKKIGIKKIVVVVGYEKETIMDYFRDSHGLTYVVQDKQLGTAHALLQAREFVHEPFIVLAGDNIIDHHSILKLVKEKSKTAMLIKEHKHPSKYGVVFIKQNKLQKIIEKPLEESSRFISTGIYKLPKSIFNEIENYTSQGIYDLTSVIQSLVNKGEKIQTIVADQWMDIVYPWDILDVNGAITHDASASVEGNIEKNVIIKGRVCIGKDTTIYSGCYISGPVIIGEGCEIGPNACIFPSTTIGNNVIIHPFSDIKNSVIMDDVHIGSSSFISHSVIGKGNTIASKFSTIPGRSIVKIEEEFKEIDVIGTVIGDDCKIGSLVTVDPGKIIGRGCNIDSFKKIGKNLPSHSNVI